MIRFYERWPGLEHLSRFEFETKPLKSAVRFELKNLDDKSKNMLNKLVKKIDDHSVLGEWGVRFCLVSSLILLLLGFFQASLIPLIVLIGSVVRFIFETKKVSKQPVQVTPEEEEIIEEIVFGKKSKKSGKRSSKKDPVTVESTSEETEDSDGLESED